MKLTAKDYRAVLEVVKEIKSSGKGLVDYCNDRIAELEKPAPKRYRCIKNSFPFKCWTVGEDKYKSTGDVEYSEHPFHFEEIMPEPVKEPITWRKVVTMLAIFGHRLPEGNSRTEHFDLIKQIKEGHGA